MTNSRSKLKTKYSKHAENHVQGLFLPYASFIFTPDIFLVGSIKNPKGRRPFEAFTCLDCGVKKKRPRRDSNARPSA